MLGIGPRLTIEGSGFKIIVEQIADDSVVEKLHTAIGVVDHEPFPCASSLWEITSERIASSLARPRRFGSHARRPPEAAYFADRALHPCSQDRKATAAQARLPLSPKFSA